MSGGDSLRGYLVQTLVCLLEALQNTAAWEAVALEPEHESEKVDVKWRYPECTKVVQIKSSRNAFRLRQVKDWCVDLASSAEAEEYELLLVGPTASQSVVKLGECRGVRVPPPKSLDIEGMVKQAAQDLGTYCEQSNIPLPGPSRTLLLAHALVVKLEIESIYGRWLEREQLDRLLRKWVFALIPEVGKEDVDMPVDELVALVRSLSPQREPWKQALKLRHLGNRSDSPVSMRELLGHIGKMVLLGKGGSGKTNYMQATAYELNQDPQEICFWVPLVSYTESLVHSVKSLLGWHNLPDDQVVSTLEKHEISLFLDGVNEVAEGQRRQCANEIQQLLASYRGKLCISYPTIDHTYFGFDCQAYEIQPLNESQIVDTIETYFRYIGKPGRATWFLQTVRGWSPERQQDFDALAQTPINLHLMLELAEADEFEYQSLRDLYGRVIQKRLQRTKQRGKVGEIPVGVKTDCLTELAYRAIVEDRTLQMPRAFVKGVLSVYLSPVESAVAMEEIIRSGLLVEDSEFLLAWPHSSFRDYLAGRRLLELLEMGASVDPYPFGELRGAVAAAHATRLATTQARDLTKRPTVFLSTIRETATVEVMKAVAEEYHTARDYYCSLQADLACDASTYRRIQWGERFLSSYKLVADAALRSGLSGVDTILHPSGMQVFFDSAADFCLMAFSDTPGIRYRQLADFEPEAAKARKGGKTYAGFCLYAPFLLLIDPEIMAYLVVGVWLRLAVPNSNEPRLTRWHDGLTTYLRPARDWITWDRLRTLPEPSPELVAGRDQAFRVLRRVYGMERVYQLASVTDIKVRGERALLSWNEMYAPVTFRIDALETSTPPKPVSNRLGQLMVLAPLRHHISLALLLPRTRKVDLGVSLLVPFPVPTLHRYYSCHSVVMSGNLSVSFAHLRG